MDATALSWIHGEAHGRAELDGLDPGARHKVGLRYRSPGMVSAA